jgi:phage pi2 protein 07
MAKRLKYKFHNENDEIAKNFLLQDGTTIDDFFIYKNSYDDKYGCIYYCSPEGDSWMLRLDDLMEAICGEFLERNNVLVFTTTEQMIIHENNRKSNHNNQS